MRFTLLIANHGPGGSPRPRLGAAHECGADSKKIDLRTKAGVEAVKGEWRYSDVKLIEVVTTTADGKPTTTYNIEPNASPGRLRRQQLGNPRPDHARQAPGGRPGLLRLVSDQDHHPRGGRGQNRVLPDGRRRLRRGLGRRCAPPQAWRHGRTGRRGLQHARIGSSSKTRSRARCTRSRSSGSTGRSPPRPATGSSSGRRSWNSWGSDNASSLTPASCSRRASP